MREPSTLQRVFAAAAAGDDLVERTLEHNVLGALFDGARAPATYDRFIILERVGAGAMGTVFAAYDPKLDRRVALKVMSSASAIAQEQHLEEARALARLNHPNVVIVHDAGQCDGTVFVAMEYVEGTTLEVHLERHRPAPAEVVGLFLDAARGLSAAHRAGVIHRDFKPTNVLVGIDGRVRVADFGLARTTEIASDPDTGSQEGDVASTIAGTPFYMAPEQRSSGVANPRTDQYAFCVALEEALGGPGKTLPVSARRKRAIARGRHEIPAERFDSMDGLIDALEPRRGTTAWALVSLPVGLSIAGALYYGNPDPCEDATMPMQDLWTATRSSDVRAAFAGSPLPYAQVSGGVIQERLDRYVEHLTQAHQDVCEASERSEYTSTERIRAQQCLSRLRARLDATLDLLTSPEPSVVATAHPLVSSLPDADICAAADPLRTSALPLDAAQRAEVLAVEVALDEIEVQRILGRDLQVRSALEELGPRLEALDYPPLAVEFEYMLGMSSGGTPQAAPALRRALWKAEELGETRTAARAAEALARQASSERSLDQARVWIDLAAALRRRQTGRSHTSARIAELETSMAIELGDLKAAAEHLEVYARLAEVETDHLGVLFLRSEIALGHGDPAAALQDLELAVELALSGFGPGSDAEASALAKRGTAYLIGEQPESAVTDLQRAATIFAADSGPDDTRTLAALNRLASAQLEVGHVEDSVETFRRLEKTITERFGEPHPAVMGIRRNLAWAERRAGEPEASLQTCRAARLAAPKPVEDATRAELDLCEAEALLLVGRPDEAVTVLEPWVEDASLPSLGALQFSYGAALFDDGDVEAGIRWVRRSVDASRSNLEPGELSAPERWLQERAEHDKPASSAHR